MIILIRQSFEFHLNTCMKVLEASIDLGKIIVITTNIIIKHLHRIITVHCALTC